MEDEAMMVHAELEGDDEVGVGVDGDLVESIVVGVMEGVACALIGMPFSSMGVVIVVDWRRY